MPDNKVNGEDFKEFNPNNGVNNKEEGNTKKFSTGNLNENIDDKSLNSKKNQLQNEKQIEDDVLDNSYNDKDNTDNKSVPFSENSKAKDNPEDYEESLEEEAPFIEKKTKKIKLSDIMTQNNDTNQSKLSNEIIDNSEESKNQAEDKSQEEDINIGDLLNSKKVIMIDDNDMINLDDVSKNTINLPKNVSKFDQDHIDDINVKKGKVNDNLPNTFEELIAERPDWKPVIKSEDEKMNTISGAINTFYKEERCFKFPLLNEEDSKITEFDVTDGIYAYKRMNPFPHWHFITKKLSDLYETLWDGSKLSGVGFELTFRLKSDDELPPKFGVDFIQEFAGYAYSSGNFIASGHVIPIKGITNFPKGSVLNAVTVVYDPDLDSVKTDRGVREFLQVVGITKNEQISIKSWNSIKVIELFSKYLEMFITDVNRQCLLEINEVDKEIQEGIKKDGSNTGIIFSEKIIWKKKRRLVFFTEYVIEVDLDSIKTLEKVIKGRIPKARELIIVGEKNKIIFKPNPISFTMVEEEGLIIGLSPVSFKDFLGKIRNRIMIFRVKSLVNTKFRVI